jgi:hypothetical protein
MKFCPVVPEICCGQVHGPRKERRRKRRIIIIKIIIRNSKNIKSPLYAIITLDHKVVTDPIIFNVLGQISQKHSLSSTLI